MKRHFTKIALLPLCALALPFAAMTASAQESAEQQAYKALGLCVAPTLVKDDKTAPISELADNLKKTCHTESQKVVDVVMEAKTHTPTYEAYTPEQKQAFTKALKDNMDAQFIEPGSFFTSMVTSHRASAK